VGTETGSTTGSGTEGGTTVGTETGSDDGSTVGSETGTDEETGPVYVTEKLEQTFQQNEEQKAKVDILWVIDNSGSMGDEQDSLAYNFGTFITRFLSEDVDFRMGVTTTDTRAGFLGRDVDSANKRLTADEAKKNESQFIHAFKSIVKVGTHGSGREQGLLTTEAYLKDKKNVKNFLRDDAYLIVVIVSDEEEQSSQSAKHYANYLWGLKNGNKGLVKVYSIVTTPDTKENNLTCTTVSGQQVCYANSYFSGSIGYKYMELSKLTNGKSHDIHEDFYSILENMGGNIVDLLDSFALNEAPSDEASIVVSVNGVVEVNWAYNPETNAIKFMDGSIPLAGSEIKVEYTRLVEQNK
jgi:hypothetical protein